MNRRRVNRRSLLACVLGSLTLGLGALCPHSAQAAVTRHALLVAATDGGLDLERLQYSERDARSMAQTLDELGGFDPQDIVVLVDPTRAELDAALDAAQADSSSEEDLFLFYYSGHADAAGLRLGDEGFPFAQLKAEISAVEADLTLGILDACRSGAITQVKGAAMVDPFLGTELASSGEVWITASSQDERAQESDRIQGSFFTHHLVSGLRGAADTGDGVVTLSEAYSYAYTHTVEQTQRTFAGTQTPMYDYKLSGSGDLRLTHLSDASSQLVLAPGFGGRILIVQDTERDGQGGAFVAELTKTSDEPLILALPAGDYILRRRQDGALYELRLHLAPDSRFVVDQRWGSAKQELAVAKGLSADEEAPVVAPEDAVAWTPITDPDRSVQGEELPTPAHSVRYFGPVQDAVETRAPAMAEAGSYAVDVAKEMDWRHDRRVAASASTLLAGGGQFYNGQYLRGAGYFVATSALIGSSWAFSQADGPFFTGSVTGSTPASLIGAAIWGMSISRAYSYQAGGRGSQQRPVHGVALATETAWSGKATQPLTAGFSADWVLVDGFSIGIDRAGWTRSSVTDSGTASVGGRVMVA
ncbi:MAG: hypothetical protein ACI9VR_005458, partial [Cognaticolwellia sp.]